MTDTLNPVTVMPKELKAGHRLGFKVIAVMGYAHDWVAYSGLTSWTDKQVVDHGDKLSCKTAEALFHAPVAAGLRYRS